MKNGTVLTVVACIAFVIVAAVPSHGQVLFKGNVPFDFYVGGEVLPAGEYTIARFGWSSPVLVLSSGVRRVEIMTPLITESCGYRETDKLIFHSYGREHFLAEIWTSGMDDKVVRTLPVHPRERQLAKAGVSSVVAFVH